MDNRKRACVHPSEHASRCCIRLCMCYCKPPCVLPGCTTHRNGWSDTNFSCGNLPDAIDIRANAVVMF